MDVWIAGAIFIVAYALIAIEPFDRTLIAQFAGLLVIVLGIVDQHEAFAAIDLNVIFLLAGMMVIAGILAKSGLFDWVAVRSVRLVHGRPMPLLLLLATVTALLSALLDNVTTVLLIVPVTIAITRRLGGTPVPYLISQVLASNIGGTATLIGDPPNILIGSAAGLDFLAFAANLAPVVLLLLPLLVAGFWLIYRRGGRLGAPSAEGRAALVRTDPRALISDRRLLRVSLAVLALTVAGFVLHGVLGYEAGTVAMFGAVLLLLLSRVDLHEVLAEVEWPTIFFFVGLFVLVGGVEE